MAEHLTEYTDNEFSATTVRRRLKGLSGEKKNVPKKYHTENRYLKKIPHHPDNSINYAVTDDGRATVRETDIPLNLNMLSSSESLGRGFQVSGSGGGVRPHKCWSRELVRRRSGSAADGLDWGDRRAVLAEKDIGWEVVEKELPHREQSEVGELVHHGSVRLILFESSVLIRYSLPESDDGIFEVLDEWWETRREAVDWLESVFPVKVRSAPLDVSMPLSTQEWGDVRNEFAEWIESNPEFQDDSPNSLFEVKNDRGERVFHVDTSPEDSLGNDVAEGEFPHSQFGAGHITNMKQAVKWMATLGVKPQDFTAAQWTRRNHEELEKVVELDVDELEERVGDLEDSVDGLEEDVDSLESQVTRLDGKMDGVSEGLQQNREWIDDVEERVDDTVERVDATRKEFQGLRQDVDREIESVRSDVGDRVESVQEAVEEELEGVQSSVEEMRDEVVSEVEDLEERNVKQLQAISGLASVMVQGQEKSERQHEELVEEVRELQRVQERGLVDKARDAAKDLKSAGKSVIGSAKSAVGGLL